MQYMQSKVNITLNLKSTFKKRCVSQCGELFGILFIRGINLFLKLVLLIPKYMESYTKRLLLKFYSFW